MRRCSFAVLLLLLFSSPLLAWNEKGHMVIARMAWQKLDCDQRRAVTEILKAHPHYDEFLAAERPEGVGIDEWVFMRASYWSDWVRSNHTDQYSRPTWHYYSVAYVPPHSKKDASSIERNDPNVITQIPFSMEKVRSGDAREKAIYLCWLLHLIGDIHQPLHCGSQLDEKFPEGDRGGNLAMVRFNGGEPVRLHSAWDAMLGEDFSLPSVYETVEVLEKIEQQNAEALKSDLREHPTSADWAREGFESVEEHVYLQGDLRPAHAYHEADVAAAPNLADAYVENATRVARLAAVRAGNRLAVSIAASLD
ncbi:MAG: hypothetical protein DWQ37_18005 [Planctomycetota bacterium]|nr:MAG: hypothetical protein DWQ37_18005 [Planctomycetota bacterium]